MIIETEEDTKLLETICPIKKFETWTCLTMKHVMSAAPHELKRVTAGQ